MAKKRVIIELTPTADLEAMALTLDSDEKVDSGRMPDLKGVEYDETFAPVALPRLVEREQDRDDPHDVGPLLDLAMEPGESTYVVRAEVDEDRVEEIREHSAVAGVFSDPVIEPCIVCPGSAALGNDADVERLLCAPAMRGIGMDGSGVLVAIVDTGVNLAYLKSHGKTPNFDAARSWVPQSGLTPGSMPVDHGTMCAFDVCIAAPRCTLLDVALLSTTATGPTIMSGYLSDGVRAYRHLIDVMLAPRRPGETRSMVVNNSWGMFNPSWDFPPGDPGNYSDNPKHPFNQIVAQLEVAGADILFAAGNCGSDCPDGRCEGVTSNAIYGANSHPSVLCVAGVDTTKKRVGYSTKGPGRLTRNKPDISSFTHFQGSGVYPADGGTSAATPVAAGVVAALRTKRPYDPANTATHPAAIRSFVIATAEDLDSAGYDYEFGYGAISGCELYRRMAPLVSLCKLYPWLCHPYIPPIDICKSYPWLCHLLPKPHIPRIPDPGPIKRHPAEPRPAPMVALPASPELEEVAGLASSLGLEQFDPIEMSYVLGWMHASQGAAPGSSGAPMPGAATDAGGDEDCGCGH